MEIIILSLLSAASLLIIFSKVIGFRRCVRHHKIIDVLCTCGLPFLFFGSFSGMATAIIAGVFISLFLWSVQKLLIL